MNRRWAFWRRVQYGAGVAVVLLLLGTLGYFRYLYAPPTCTDGRQNGDERGVDCGGSCRRICALDVMAPTVKWAQAFRVTKGQYNAVAYVENLNVGIGTPELAYTFTLYDEKGEVITTRAGTTFLPPSGVYPLFEGRIAVGDQVPARTFLELAPVEHWQGASGGKDDFVVRSRALTGADNKPRLDTVIYNASLTDQNNIAVVATLFDVRGNALTSSQSVVPRFASRTEQSVVFTWPEPIAKTVRSCEVPTDVLVAIDLSGSMNNDGGTPAEPLASALRAASSFVSLIRKNDRAGVVTYATTATLVEGLTGTHAATQDIIRALRIDPKEETGQTNIGDALIRVREEFASSRHNPDARKVLVLLTDGKANAPGNDAEAYALTQAETARADDITIFTIGLGSAVNDTFLSAIAGEATRRYHAPSAADLDGIYRSISTALCEEGAAVIDIIPRFSLILDASK